MRDLEKRVGEAIKLFWLVRDKQSDSQGEEKRQQGCGSKGGGHRRQAPGWLHRNLPRPVYWPVACRKRMCIGRTETQVARLLSG